MSGEVRIYAASDDLIEIEGAISEEFNNVDFCDSAYVFVSTGDVLRFRLEDEGWRAMLVVDATSPTIERGREDDDIVTVAGPVAWVVAGTEPPARSS